MLTSNDLQQIRKLVREEVHVGIQEETPKIFLPIVQQELTPIKKDIQLIKKKLNKISKDVNTLIPYFNGRITKLEIGVKSLKQN